MYTNEPIILHQATATDEEALYSYITAHGGAAPRTIKRMGGYSNRNYHIIQENGSCYTARIARLNRSTVSITAEVHILQSIARTGSYRIPELKKELLSPDPLPCEDGLHAVHFFEHIEGAIDCLWWQQCSILYLQQIFTSLASLHSNMSAIPGLPGYEAALYNYPLPDKAPSLLMATATGSYVIDQWQQFKKAAMRLQQDVAAAFPWQQSHCQWIHGDIQTENVLFHNNNISAILDFEQASWDACEKDVILSAFRTCKEDNSDAPFKYDAARLQIALKSYLDNCNNLDPGFFDQYETLWKPFFCLDQSMLYLNNAFDGIWQLDAGIGFLPCFNEVLAYR